MPDCIFLIDELEQQRELNRFAFNVIVDYAKVTPIYLRSFPILKLQSIAGIVIYVKVLCKSFEKFRLLIVTF